MHCGELRGSLSCAGRASGTCGNQLSRKNSAAAPSVLVRRDAGRGQLRSHGRGHPISDSGCPRRTCRSPGRGISDSRCGFGRGERCDPTIRSETPRRSRPTAAEAPPLSADHRVRRSGKGAPEAIGRTHRRVRHRGPVRRRPPCASATRPEAQRGRRACVRRARPGGLWDCRSGSREGVPRPRSCGRS